MLLEGFQTTRHRCCRVIFEAQEREIVLEIPLVVFDELTNLYHKQQEMNVRGRDDVEVEVRTSREI